MRSLSALTSSSLSNGEELGYKSVQLDSETDSGEVFSISPSSICAFYWFSILVVTRSVAIASLVLHSMDGGIETLKAFVDRRFPRILVSSSSGVELFRDVLAKSIAHHFLAQLIE